MADNTDNEHLNNPTNTQSENLPNEIITTETETINSIQETEEMEVHHHAHHEGKKNWKSYVWEFLMLFLAVFCGFLAEYQLEHTIEHNREKEFVLSMIEDAQMDTTNLKKALEHNKKQLQFIDTLASYCFNFDNKNSSDYEIYRLFREVLSASDAVKPTERTLVQLKYSGGMRLIKNKVAVDVIILYDGKGKDVAAIQENNDKVGIEGITFSYELINYNYFNPGKYLGVSKSAELLSHDKIKLIQFASRIATIGAGLSVYRQELQLMNDTAVKLINTLKQEYHITDN